MEPKPVTEIVEEAVGQAWDAWAAEHPSQAAVIDQLDIKHRTAAELRETEEYRAAVEAYHDGLAETDMLKRLVEMAVPLVGAVLGG